MSDIALDSSGDILIVKNEMVIVTGTPAVTQHLSIRFKLFLGEWFLDTTAGVPWFRDVLVKGTSFAVVDKVLRNTILETPNVLELLNFDFVFNSFKREATLGFSALSSDGVIDFSQIVEIGQ